MQSHDPHPGLMLTGAGAVSCGSHIALADFDKWNITRQDLTARFYKTPALPGRVRWINGKNF